MAASGPQPQYYPELLPGHSPLDTIWLRAVVLKRLIASVSRYAARIDRAQDLHSSQPCGL